MAYITTADLEGENIYFSNFAENLYGTNGTLGTAGSARLVSDIKRAFDIINDELRSMGRFSLVPIPIGESGEYPQSIVDANAYRVVYDKLISRFQAEFENMPPSIEHYGTMYRQTMQRISDGGIIFDEEIDVGELGIGQPSAYGNLGSDTRGTFHNNWRGYPFSDSDQQIDARRSSFNLDPADDAYEGFAGYDFPRTWVIEIDGAGAIGTATFKWSRNNGKDWAATGVKTQEVWGYLYENVYVRFEPGPLGSNYFTSGDKWTFKTVPESIRHTYGEDEVHVAKGWRSF